MDCWRCGGDASLQSGTLFLCKVCHTILMIYRERYATTINAIPERENVFQSRHAKRKSDKDIKADGISPACFYPSAYTVE